MMEPTIYSKGLKLQAGPDARAFQVNGRHCLGILESYNSVTRRSFGRQKPVDARIVKHNGVSEHWLNYMHVFVC